ncbi:MAG: DMT family transporter [Bacteroidota bacterium]|nr:DMT family transporter [Bacteroidota bacterium]
MQAHIGEFAALATAALWTVTALAFEQASKRVGSLAVNLIRLFLALILYCIFNLFRGDPVFPQGVSQYSWFWLSLSALIGFVFGDYCLFQAYSRIGSRVASLMMALAPPLAAIFGWMILGESFSLLNSAGMALTLLGIVIVIMDRPGKKIIVRYSLTGILFGLGGAVGQAIGLVFSKLGMVDLDPFVASQIRVIAGLTGFIILFTIFNRWHKLKPAFGSMRNIGFISIGAFFGPFLGVSFSLLSVKHTSTGTASTIMAIVPVLIIPPAILLLKEKVSLKEVAGAFIAVSGVALFFL